MKTPLLALVAVLASTPACASLGLPDQIDQASALQPATYTEPAGRPVASDCGTPQKMMLILHDATGAIVGTAVVLMPSDC